MLSASQPPACYGTEDQACRRQWQSYDPKNTYDGFVNTENWWQKVCRWHGPLLVAPTSIYFNCDTGYVAMSPGLCIGPGANFQSSARASCRAPNHGGTSDPWTPYPVNILTGAKSFSADDFVDAAGLLAISRSFNSRPHGASGASLNAPALGFANWLPQFAYELQFGPDWNSARVVSILTPDGGFYRFRRDAVTGQMVSDVSATYPLPRTDYALQFDGTWPSDLSTVRTSATKWKLTDADGRIWVLAPMLDPGSGQYSVARPVQMIDPSGGQVTFAYGASGQLLWMNDSFGREIRIDWIVIAGKLASISTIHLPDATKLQYVYESTDGSTASLYPDRLIRVVRQDALGTILDQTSYQYADTRFPTSVTAILDKDGATRWTVTYDDRGRAVSSSGPSSVDSTTIAYGAEGTTTTRTVTNALGKSAVYTYSRSSLSVYDLALVSVVGQISANCPSTTASTTYGSDKFIATQADEEGRVTAYTRNSRGLPTQTIEAQGTSSARTSSTTWHADVPKPTQIVETGLTTDFSYDNQAAIGPPSDGASSGPLADTSTPHAYWRIRVDRIEGGDRTSISGLGIFAQQGGDDLTSGGTVMASDALTGSASAQAFDRNGATDWASGLTTGAWIGYHFASPVLVRFLGLSAGALPAAAPRSFSVEFSDDGTNWSPLWNVSVATPWNARETRYFIMPGFTYSGSLHGARTQWRLALLSTAHTAYALREAEFRAVPGGADQATGGTAYASQVYNGSYPAANAFDDNLSTLWSGFNANAGQVLQYNFSSAVSVSEVSLTARTDLSVQAPKSAVIEYWNSTMSAWIPGWYYNTPVFSSGQTKLFKDPYYVSP